MQSSRPVHRRRSFRRFCVLLGLSIFVLASALSAQSEGTRTFNIPADVAEKTLKLFSEQSGRGLIMNADTVGAVRTNAVQGDLKPADALVRMLANTALVATEDRKSGSYVVKLEKAPAEKNAPSRPASDRAASEEKDGVIKLETFEVFGQKTLNMDIPRSRDDAQPYVIFNRDTIEKSGASNLEDFLKMRLTMNAQGKNNAQSPNTQIKTSQVNLRGLGASQTLILIDGNRAPSVSYLDAAVQADLNGIPLSAIERIEVLPTTASGIYGGNATGGVINIVLRRDYVGAELTASYGNTFDSDVGSFRVDLNAGFTLEKGKTSVLISASHSQSNALLVQDRTMSQAGRARIMANNPAVITAAANPPEGALVNVRSTDGSPLFGPGTPSFTYVPAGYTTAMGLAPLQANAGKYDLNLSPSAYFATGGPGSGGEGLLPATEILALNGVIRRQFGSRLQAFVMWSYSSNQSESNVTVQSPTFTIAATAPNNVFKVPVRVTLPITASNSVSHFENEVTGAIGGLIYKFSDAWMAEADFSWSDGRISFTYPPAFAATAATAISNGTIDVLRDFAAQPVDFSSYLAGQPNFLYSAPPFGNVQRSGALRSSGELWDLPGGALRISGLAEYRETDLNRASQTAPTVNSVTIYDGKSQSVQSAYLELKAPIFSAKNARPGLQELELQMAARTDRYKTDAPSPIFGSATTVFTRVRSEQSSTNPTIAARYRPVQDVMIRTSWGQGFKVPELGQMAPGTISNFSLGGGANDPLRGNTVLGPYQGVSGGNALIKPEKSESLSAGVIITPRLVPGLRLSVDYLRIEKEDNILNPTLQQLFDNETLFPGRIVRGANLPTDPAGWAGVPSFIDRTALNAATAEIEAYDTQIDYTYKNPEFGTLDFFAAATWQTHYRLQLLPTTPITENVGLGAANPLKLKANAGVTWRRKQWTLGWQVSYFHSYIVSASATDILNQGNGGRVPRQVYHDLYLAYRVPHGHRAGPAGWIRGLEVKLGVQNVFDREPPVDLAASSILQYSYFSDPRQARYVLTVKQAF